MSLGRGRLGRHASIENSTYLCPQEAQAQFESPAVPSRFQVSTAAASAEKAVRSGASPHACAAREALQRRASGAAARFQRAGYSRAANALSLAESVVPPGRATPSVK